MKREFYRLVGSTHEGFVKSSCPDLADEVLINVYDDTPDGSYVDGGFRWRIVNRNEKPYARLELYDDAWAGFFTHCQDLMERMKSMKNCTPEQMIECLLELGFTDETRRA